MSKLTVAGIGPGEADYILPAVIEKMKKAHTVIAAKRVLPILEELCQDVSDSASVLQHDSISFFAMGKIKDTLEQIGKILSEGHDVVMAVSGDPLMYSLYRTICNDPISENWDMDIIPGVGSLQMLGAAFGETMEDALIISVHGRAKTAGSIALAVTEHPKVFFLCSKEQGPAWLSRIMLDYQLDDVTVCAGANLSYEDEILASGTPAEMVKKEFPSLCVAMIKNPSPRQIVRPCFLSDEDFERDKTPMTKEEIRILILHKMKLHPDDVVWDVGAGTGSVSIECARQVPFGTVHSVERSETAVKLIYKNFFADIVNDFTVFRFTVDDYITVKNSIFCAPVKAAGIGADDHITLSKVHITCYVGSFFFTVYIDCITIEGDISFAQGNITLSMYLKFIHTYLCGIAGDDSVTNFNMDVALQIINSCKRVKSLFITGYLRLCQTNYRN